MYLGLCLPMLSPSRALSFVPQFCLPCKKMLARLQKRNKENILKLGLVASRNR
jgi:hypothetical protein